MGDGGGGLPSIWHGRFYSQSTFVLPAMNMHVLLVTGCTLPVSSAKAELSFSGLPKIKAGRPTSETGCLSKGRVSRHSVCRILDFAKPLKTQTNGRFPSFNRTL